MNYGDATGYKAYHEARGRIITDSDEVIVQKLIAGSEWIDAMYGNRYQGTKVGQRDQVLGWPRVGAVDRDGYAISSETVPVEIINATYEAAFRSGNLFKDYTPGKYSRVVITGSIDVTYRDVDALDLQMQSPIIGAILDSLLGGYQALSGLSGKSRPGMKKGRASICGSGPSCGATRQGLLVAAHEHLGAFERGALDGGGDVGVDFDHLEMARVFGRRLALAVKDHVAVVALALLLELAVLVADRRLDRLLVAIADAEDVAHVRQGVERIDGGTTTVGLAGGQQNVDDSADLRRGLGLGGLRCGGLGGHVYCSCCGVEVHTVRRNFHGGQ